MLRYWLWLLLFTAPVFAQEYNPPVTISLVGPVSTNFGRYHQSINHFCIGLINCSSLDLKGVSIAYGYNGVDRDMRGVAIGLLGNYAGNDAGGIQLGWLANLTLGHMHGMQMSLANYTQGTFGGLQFGALNVIAGNQEDRGVAVQFGVVNVSNQANVIPFGLLNLSRNGRFSLDLSRDLVGYNRVLLATGSRYFYIIYSVDSRGLNPKKRETFGDDYHQVLAGGGGFGGAYPVLDDVQIRAEYLYYTPTHFERDVASVYRVVAEFEASAYFAGYVGYEEMSFVHEGYRRSTPFEGTADRLQSLTVGVTLNLLGWWR